MQNLTIGERIHLLRETLKKQDKKKYSLQSVASRVGVATKQSLSLIERGKIKSPSSVILSKIAADFGVTVDYLLTGIGGNKEGYLEKKKLLSNTLDDCRRAVERSKAECPTATYYLYEKASNLLDLFDVLSCCFEREVLGNYDLYSDGMEKLISFLESVAAVIPKLGRKQDLESFIDRAFWNLGKAVRQAAVQIDKDGNLRNLYPEELQEIANTAVLAVSTDEKNEPVSSSQTFDVVVKDFQIRLTYHGLIDIPEEYLAEFKKRVIFEWELMLARLKVLNKDTMTCRSTILE
jgi:transcriptional regulator with XRE-family HTH domain